jgi:lipopolysaccharide transport protein LptA
VGVDTPKVEDQGNQLKMKKYLLSALLIAALMASGCGRKEPPETKDKHGSEGRSSGSEGRSYKTKDSGMHHKVLSFNLEGLTDKGEKKWEVIGRTARSISENEIRLGNIVAKTYGDEEAVITADQGVYNRTKNNVRLEKNVIATIENAGSAVKDQLGLSVDPAGQSREAQKKEIPGKPKEKRKIIITCDGEVEFDYAKNLAYFKDNVKVKSEDGDIDADKITVNLDPSSKKINDIVAEGHVKITQNDNIAYGDKAQYNETDKKISLNGSPKLIISEGNDNILKERILER